jgi:drug/metabolite transporter (DMT)-like permease
MTSTTQAAPHTAATRPLELGAAFLIVFLCLCWGFNQVAVKLALPDIPPLIQAAVRSAGAALLIWIYARARGISLDIRDETLIAGLVAGVLFTVEFLFIYRSLLYTTASRAVLFIYSAPFVVVLGAHFLVPGDRFRWMQWAGLLMSFAGLALAFGVPEPAADPHQLFGDALALGGGVAWGLTTLLVKATSLARSSAEKTLQYQLVISALLLPPAAYLLGERVTHMPGALALWSLAYQTVWVVAITFLLWFILVIRYSASRLSAFTFLTPLFGVFAGYVTLGDPITPAFAVSVALVIAGLILVNRPH